MCNYGDLRKSMWSQKHVGVFPNYRSCSNKGYYLPLESFSFPSWIKITKSSMINFPILYFPSLSAFSWPPAFLPGCKTWAAALDKSLCTQTGWNGQNSPKNSQMTSGMWFLLVQYGVRTQEEAEVLLPPHLTFSVVLDAEQTPPDLPARLSWGLHALAMAENIPNIFPSPWPYNVLWISDNPQPHISHLKLNQGTRAMLTENRHQRSDTKVPLHPVTFPVAAQVMLTHWRVFLCSQGGLESKQG